MTVGELKAMLADFHDDMWVLVGCCGDLGDPTARIQEDDGDEVLVIS